jgi:MFS transporter, SP family, sugar:H+ symporter
MAPGVMAVEKGGGDFLTKLIGQVLVCSIIAAFGGLMFGYDISISGYHPILSRNLSF